jgi:hypothetical protein
LNRRGIGIGVGVEESKIRGKAKRTQVDRGSS